MSAENMLSWDYDGQWHIGEADGSIWLARGPDEVFRTIYPDPDTVHLVHKHSGQIVIANMQRIRQTVPRRSPTEWLVPTVERWLADPEHRSINPEEV